MLSVLLKTFGDHETQLAQDGLAALEMAMTHRPDMILLGIDLPKMDGYEVAWSLREQGRDSQTLLVAITGYGNADDRRNSQQAGFDEHLVKLLGAEDLQRLFSHPKLKRRPDENVV